MIKQIVDWMIKVGTENTSTGNWNIYYDEISKVFPVTEDWLCTHHEDIVDEIDSREEIISETWDNFENEELCGFDMNFCLNACKGWDGTDDWGCIGY